MNPLDPHSIEARILVTEADDVTRMFLADNLTADGYTVQAVADHNAALAQLHDTPVDLMVADVNGPTLALVDTIRNLERLGSQTADVPVIILTAHVEQLAECLVDLWDAQLVVRRTGFRAIPDALLIPLGSSAGERSGARLAFLRWGGGAIDPGACEGDDAVDQVE